MYDLAGRDYDGIASPTLVTGPDPKPKETRSENQGFKRADFNLKEARETLRES